MFALNFSAKKYIFLVLIMTFFNVGYSILANDIWIFVVRQFLLLAYVLLLYVFRDELNQFTDQDAKIDTLLREKYPILKVETPLFFGAIIGAIMFMGCSRSPDFFILSYVGLLIMVLYLIVSWYKIFCIMITREARVYYKPQLSIVEVKALLQAEQIRRVSSAFFTQTAHVCKLCVKGTFGVGLGVWLGPKVITGDIMYRGQVLNDLTYPYTGYRATSELDVSRFNYYVARYPDERSALLDSRGYIKPLELDRRLKEKGILDLSLQHKFSSLNSLTWWMKKE